MFIVLCLGCDPAIMGIGPVPAIRSMLQATGKTLEDLDLIEVSTLTLLVVFSVCSFPWR